MPTTTSIIHLYISIFNLIDAVKQIKEPASAEGAFLTVETCEPLSQMALNNSPLVTELGMCRYLVFQTSE